MKIDAMKKGALSNIEAIRMFDEKGRGQTSTRVFKIERGDLFRCRDKELDWL